MIQNQSKLAKEITGEEIPDPDVLPDVGGHYIIIRPVSVRRTLKTKSGFELELPDNARDDIKYLCNVGRILAMGPHCFKSKTIDENGPWFTGGTPKKGEFFMYPPMSGRNFRYKGVNLKLVKDSDLVMRVDDPSYLDTFANIEAHT